MPALIEEEHPACASLITAYKHCSATAPLLRKVFASECTALKYQLDRCFQQEKADRTQHNLLRRQVSFFPAVQLATDAFIAASE